MGSRRHFVVTMLDGAGAVVYTSSLFPHVVTLGGMGAVVHAARIVLVSPPLAAGPYSCVLVAYCRHMYCIVVVGVSSYHVVVACVMWEVAWCMSGRMPRECRLGCDADQVSH